MWRPLTARIALTSVKSSSVNPNLTSGYKQFRRTVVTGGEIEPRRLRTKSGWYSRRGTFPGHPMVHAEHMREIGLDKNLQERLNELYAEEHDVDKNRTDVGIPRKSAEKVSKRLSAMELRKQQRKNKDLERMARLNLLEVDIEDVKRERVAVGAFFDDVVLAADLYGIFEDLFGPKIFFKPSVDVKISYDLDDDFVLPVHRGNVIKPRDLKNAPSIEIDAKEKDSLWTLVMSNPDGHFHEDEAEYLHWMVANVPADGDLEKADIICPYLQPFPPHGTGYHRFVFILYKQESKVDLSKYKQPEINDGVNLNARTFRTHEFFEENKNAMKPAGLSFFQSDHDESLHKVFHDVLNMPEPKYEYNFSEAYVEPWDHMYENEGTKYFNLFLDRFRDKRSVQEEILKKRLKSLHPFEGDKDREIRYPNVHEPRAFKMNLNKDMASWRVREIERERLRRGLYKDMDHFDPRRDPSNA